MKGPSRKPKFVMRQASFGGERWTHLRFGHHIEDSLSLGLSDPIISSVFGDEINYGNLFAYCFRRFGYPAVGWDDYKQLVVYYLTTPSPDLMLEIQPYAGNVASINFGFMVREEIHNEISAFDRRDKDAWYKRSAEWAEKRGLPDWMDEWVSFRNSQICRLYHCAEAKTWQETAKWLLPTGEAESDLFKQTTRASIFFRQLDADYALIEPYPGGLQRPANHDIWVDDDPLKPLASAAISALKDLLTPVFVRDIPINALGQAGYRSRSVKPSAGAGYPSGALGNENAQTFAVLHRLIMKLGKGNAKKGIHKALKMLGHDNAGKA